MADTERFSSHQMFVGAELAVDPGDYIGTTGDQFAIFINRSDERQGIKITDTYQIGKIVSTTGDESQGQQPVVVMGEPVQGRSRRQALTIKDLNERTVILVDLEAYKESKANALNAANEYLKNK